jgi:hypothetical protein
LGGLVLFSFCSCVAYWENASYRPINGNPHRVKGERERGTEREEEKGGREEMWWEGKVKGKGGGGSEAKER